MQRSKKDFLYPEVIDLVECGYGQRQHTGHAYPLPLDELAEGEPQVVRSIRK